MRQINTRNNFGKLAQEFYKTGFGAEIGVAQGKFSKEISEIWMGTIFCVDKWENDSMYKMAGNNLIDRRCCLMRGDSVDMADKLPNGLLDWVYIDAEHDYDNVKRDYNAWYPKVRNGGLIAGHDYGDNEFGVKKFIDELNIPFYLTTEDFTNNKPYQTWYFEKHE